jgi:sialate O-acetylesterase
MRKRLIIIIQLISILTVFGEIKLPSIISDNMVLQQQADVLLWGEASPNESLILTTSWDKKEYQIKANSTGVWEVKVKTISAGGPYEISIVTKSEEKKLKNVLLGEVWLCGGQSNMDMGFRGLTNQPLYNADLSNL